MGVLSVPFRGPFAAHRYQGRYGLMRGGLPGSGNHDGSRGLWQGHCGDCDVGAAAS